MAEVVVPEANRRDTDETLDKLIDLAYKSAKWTEKDARSLVDRIAELRKINTWRRRLDGEPKTWARFCIEVLGYEVAYLEKIEQGIAILEAKGVKDPTIGDVEEMLRVEVGRPRGSKTNRSNTPIKSLNQRKDASYKLARLRRDHPELAVRVESGELSPHKAGIMAGFVKERFSVTSDPERTAKSLYSHLGRDGVTALIAHLQALLDPS